MHAATNNTSQTVQLHFLSKTDSVLNINLSQLANTDCGGSIVLQTNPFSADPNQAVKQQ